MPRKTITQPAAAEAESTPERLVISPEFEEPYGKHRQHVDRETHPWLAVVGDDTEGWGWASRFETQEVAEENAARVSVLMGKPFGVAFRP